MGNVKSKKTQKEMDKFFERERVKEFKREEKKRNKANPLNKRSGTIEAPVKPVALSPGPSPSVAVATPAHLRTYDDEALDLMRYQLHYDSDAFLLNNILLSIQFFNNYECELDQIKNNPIGDREHVINDAMVQHHKHVFFADRLQECVHDHVSYERSRENIEPLVAPKLFVIYDNVEASEPGDTSDYSTVLDAPFYKLCMKDTKEPGYVKLQKLEVLKSSLMKETESFNNHKNDSDDSVYTDSEKESIASDDITETTKGQELLEKIKKRLDGINFKDNSPVKDNDFLVHTDSMSTGRRASGPTRQMSNQVQRSNISNLNDFKKTNSILFENNKESNFHPDEEKDVFNVFEKPRKSILKNHKNSSRRLSGPVKEMKSKIFHVDAISEDTETSGYRSNSGSRQNELSESESDYGYSTITESTTPKKIELSIRSATLTSGVLPEETWTPIDVRIDTWAEEDEDDIPSKTIQSQNLYETQYYLSSLGFMRNFVDIFITNLGTSLGLTQDAIKSAFTQGASIYCDSLKNGRKFECEVFPAIIAAWPNAANQFIIRERKIIQNPRTNFSYQWPTKQMVHKAIELGCFLVPVGFRPKRGQNPDQQLQWKVIFPAAERYLEKCLAHSHVRCYLFALTLQKTFMENGTSKIGIDANHFKHHLFWQCEDNFAKWPEDRLGESLRTFLQTFYIHFGQSRLPNYFMNSCNEFKSIPKPLLLKLQRKVADILEAPVTHILYALSKVKYTKRDFYPKLNTFKLYEILTCKNPLRIVNPSLPAPMPHYSDCSDSESENSFNFWDKAKAFDKNYRWKKEKQRRMEAKRKASSSNKQKAAVLREKVMDPYVKLPAKMDVERRRLVLELFIPHFIAMARSSEKFEAIGQAIIYLEQAQRLCTLLMHEPAGEITANEYLDVIRDKLGDCQRKLAKQGGYKLPLRTESNAERPFRKIIRKHRPRYDNIASNSPVESPGISPFTFVDIHQEEQKRNGTIKLTEISADEEESKL